MSQTSEPPAHPDKPDRQENRFSPGNHLALMAVAASFLVGHFVSMLLFLYGADPSDSFQAIYYAVHAYALGYWVTTDWKRRGVPVTFDFGLYFYMTLPLSLLIYLCRSRGAAKGSLALLGFVALYAAAYFAVYPIYLLLYYRLWG